MYELVQQLTEPKAFSVSQLPCVLQVPAQVPLWVVDVLRHLPGKRITLRAYWSGRPVVAKLFFAKNRAKQHFTHELNGLRVMQARGVATAPIFYAGEALSPNSYLIITGFLLGAKTFAHCLQDLSYRQNYSESFMELLQQMHVRGMIQKDLHGGNFLYWKKQWYCLDGDGIVFIKKRMTIPHKMLIANLTLACIQLISIFPDIDIKRHIQHIMPQYPNNIGNKLDKKVHKKLKSRLTAFHEMIMGKTIRNCTDFGVITTKKYRGYYQKQYWDMDDITKLFETMDVSSRLEHPALGLLEPYLYPALSMTRLVKQPLSVREWVRAWQYSQLFAYQHIPAPVMVAMQLYDGTNSHRGWVKVREGRPLLDYLSSYPYDSEKIQAIITQMFNIMKRMQQLRLCYKQVDIHCFAMDKDEKVFLVHLHRMKHYRFEVFFKQATQRQWQLWLSDLQSVPLAHRILGQAIAINAGV